MLVLRDYVFEWNAVDVLVDGRLQRGVVINAADGGLVIDFECTTRRSQFIEYGRIFHCFCDTYDLWVTKPGQGAGGAEVLLRYHPTDSWTWYPARVASTESRGHAYDAAEFMEVQLPHGSVIELVPCLQIREVATAESPRPSVTKGDFVVRCCPLPAVCWSQAPHWLGQIFQQELSRHPSTSLCAVLSQAVLYLQQPENTPLTPAKLEELYNCGCARPLPPSPMLRQSEPSSSPPRKQRKVGGESLPLPAELLVEIFQALDSIERLRCRRVCHMWNSLLTTASRFPDVRVSGKDGYYGDVQLDDCAKYWVLACLLKCLMPATKMAVVMQVCADDSRDIAQPMRYVFSTDRLLPTLVFYDCDFGDENSSAHIIMHHAAYVALEYACGRIVWKQCRIFCSKPITITQHVFSVCSQEDMEMQLFDLFEQTVVRDRSPLDLPTLAGWIAKAVAHNRDYYVSIILKTLNSYQSADPRPTTGVDGVPSSQFGFDDADPTDGGIFDGGATSLRGCPLQVVLWCYMHSLRD
ncbi:uncharacterized protein LOC129602097 [Paramacrobiotus metropolitanus]|uniref:uncharacterized protein LOC129602097 n=1 Tax=Paramacrobiotus metropolitanus TaxID=2943436 RepID=UPI0024464BA7|nr:uncharacterized protein LOC129602097 [Paramacrobiotus metropolitanus]